MASLPYRKPKQKSLHAYFSRDTQHRPSITFLDLPQSVREKVYRLAGLVRSCPIDLNTPPTRFIDKHEAYLKLLDLEDEAAEYDYTIDWFANTCVTPYKCFRSNIYFREVQIDGRWRPQAQRFRLIDDCKEDTAAGSGQLQDPPSDCCEPLPVALLFVSRQVHLETSRMLYSQNSFRISASHMLGFRQLQALGKQYVSLLRRLYVSVCIKHETINMAPKQAMFWTFDPWCTREISLDLREYLNFREGPPKRLKVELPVRMLEWQKVARKLSAEISPYQLDLYLSCRSTDERTVSYAMAPMRYLTPLKSCSLRLGEGLDQTAELWSRSLNPTRQTFRFTDLPKELQDHVLSMSFLHLKGPVKCNYFDGFTPGQCCETCAHFGDYQCFCDGDGSRSPSCCCPQQFRPIFAIKELADSAIRVFFSQNIFVFSADFDVSGESPPTFPHHATFERGNEFSTKGIHSSLNWVPVHAIRYLRRIVFHLPTSVALDPSELEDAQPFLLAIDVLVALGTLPKLAFGIYFIEEWTPSKTQDFLQTIVPSVQRLAKAGLGDFFFWVSRDWGDLTELDISSIETEVEQTIMGKEYNSEARGRSAWQGLYGAYDGDGDESS